MRSTGIPMTRGGQQGRKGCSDAMLHKRFNDPLNNDMQIFEVLTYSSGLLGVDGWSITIPAAVTDNQIRP